MVDINRLVKMIKRLSVADLIELNKKLKDMGIPPLEGSGIPVKPKPSPPSLPDAIGVDLEGNPVVKRSMR